MGYSSKSAGKVVRTDPAEKAIIKGYLVSPGRPSGEGWLELQGDVVSRMGYGNGMPTGGQVFDFGDNLVCPGFIDLHVHGGGGYDVMDGSVAALQAIACFHARGGTAAFLGATVSEDCDRLQAVLNTAAEYCSRRDPAGAKMLGVHLEGPYLNPVKKGAHAAEALKLPDVGEMRELLTGKGDLVRMVTLAPELPGSIELISFLHQQKVKVALGHSTAGRDELAAAVAAGLCHGTHMFNAMGEFHQRDPGTAGWILQMSAVTVDVIADGVHVHPAVIGMLLKLKGVDKVALITDAIGAAGRQEKHCKLGGQQVYVCAGAARLADGTLAGSTLTMNRAVANMVQMVGIAVEEAIQMASLNPAVILGLEGVCGRLEPGLKGNITVMDREFNVLATFVEGKKVVNF